MGKAKGSSLNCFALQPDLEISNRSQALCKKCNRRPNEEYQTVTLYLPSAPVTPLGPWCPGRKGCEAAIKPKEGLVLRGGRGPRDHADHGARGRLWTQPL